MIQGIYQGASSLAALEIWQASLAGNLSASGVSGYKQQVNTFDGVLRGYMEGASGGEGSKFASFRPGTGGMMPKAGMVNDFSQGMVRDTGKPTDFALEGPGFFQVVSPEGEELLTRNGEFQFNLDNQLVNNRGWVVMGQDGPIERVPTGGEVTLEDNGELMQDGQVIGQFRIVEAGDPGQLMRRGGGFALSDDQRRQLQDVEEPRLRQAAVESSNTSTMREMVQLIQVSRAYEANQKVIQSADQVNQSVIQNLGRTQ